MGIKALKGAQQIQIKTMFWKRDEWRNVFSDENICRQIYVVQSQFLMIVQCIVARSAFVAVNMRMQQVRWICKAKVNKIAPGEVN